MTTSEATLRAIKKYDSKMDIIRFRVPKEMGAIIKKYAEQNGESINQLMNRLIMAELNRNDY